MSSNEFSIFWNIQSISWAAGQSAQLILVQDGAAGVELLMGWLAFSVWRAGGEIFFPYKINYPENSNRKWTLYTSNKKSHFRHHLHSLFPCFSESGNVKTKITLDKVKQARKIYSRILQEKEARIQLQLKNNNKNQNKQKKSDWRILKAEVIDHLWFANWPYPK